MWKVAIELIAMYMAFHGSQITTGTAHALFWGLVIISLGALYLTLSAIADSEEEEEEAARPFHNIKIKENNEHDI